MSDPRADQVVARGLEPFSRFYARERVAMVTLAYATSGSRLAAEDMAREAFVAAFRDWDRVGRLDNPATWVRGLWSIGRCPLFAGEAQRRGGS